MTGFMLTTATFLLIPDKLIPTHQPDIGIDLPLRWASLITLWTSFCSFVHVAEPVLFVSTFQGALSEYVLLGFFQWFRLEQWRWSIGGLDGLQKLLQMFSYEYTGVSDVPASTTVHKRTWLMLLEYQRTRHTKHPQTSSEYQHDSKGKMVLDALLILCLGSCYRSADLYW